MTITRNDGLNNQLSLNSSIGLSADDIRRRCSESDAVQSYGYDGKVWTIEWAGEDGHEYFSDPQAVLIAIRTAEQD